MLSYDANAGTTTPSPIAALLGAGARRRSVRRDTDSNRPRIVAVKCGHSHAIAVDHTGGVWAWGCNAHGQVVHHKLEHIATPTQVTLTDIVHPSDRCGAVGGGGNRSYGCCERSRVVVVMMW